MNANDFWEFLAGLGIFMFGMFLLENALTEKRIETSLFISKTKPGLLEAAIESMRRELR